MMANYKEFPFVKIHFWVGSNSNYPKERESFYPIIVTVLKTAAHC